MKILQTCPSCGGSDWIRSDDQFKCAACGEACFTEEMCSAVQEDPKQMREFSVRIVLSELTIVADSAERAEEIAVDILDSDARTRLSHGLCVEACEVEEQGPSDEEETEV